MSIIDRYLLRQYIQVLTICLCSLMGLYAVIDALGHLDQFSNYSEQSGSSILATIARFYTYQSLGFFDRTSGVLAMMAALFTIAWLKRNNELTALLAAGISQFRTALPVILASAGIAVVAAANREMILPSIRSELLRDTKDLAGTAERPLGPMYDPATDIVLGGEATVARDRRIIKPFLLLLNQPGSDVRRITAAQGRFTPGTELHPPGYTLSGVRAGARFLEGPSLKVAERTILYAPYDTPWLEPDEVFFPTAIGFDQLASGPRWRNFASTAELIAFVKHPASDVPTEAYVTLHGRFVRPLLDITLVIIGLPLILSRRSRSPFLAVGLAMTLVAVFSIVALTCEFLGNSRWISPSLAAWLPLCIFVPLAVASSGPLRR